jgi:hypothetical protein
MKLLCACLSARQSIGQSHPQIVVAVHADGDVHDLLYLADHVIGSSWIHDANSVGDAYVVGMAFLCLFVKLLQGLEIGSRGILG